MGRPLVPVPYTGPVDADGCVLIEKYELQRLQDFERRASEKLEQLKSMPVGMRTPSYEAYVHCLEWLLNVS